jgi:hypothetical protein
MKYPFTGDFIELIPNLYSTLPRERRIGKSRQSPLLGLLLQRNRPPPLVGVTAVSSENRILATAQHDEFIDPFRQHLILQYATSVLKCRVFGFD